MVRIVIRKGAGATLHNAWWKTENYWNKKMWGYSHAM